MRQSKLKGFNVLVAEELDCSVTILLKSFGLRVARDALWKSQDYQRWQGYSYHLIHTSAGKSWEPSKVLIPQGQEDQRGVVIFPRSNSKLMAELPLEEGVPLTPTLHPHQYTHYLVHVFLFSLKMTWTNFWATSDICLPFAPVLFPDATILLQGLFGSQERRRELELAPTLWRHLAASGKIPQTG